MDLPPILIALGARVRTVGPSGERWIDMADLITGYYQLAIARDELIVEVHVPAQPANVIHVLREIRRAVGRRLAVGGGGGLVPHGRRPDHRRARRGERRDRSADARVQRRGGPCRRRSQRGRVCEGRRRGGQEVEPLADIRGSAAYKREMVRVHVRRALAAALHSPSRRAR